MIKSLSSIFAFLLLSLLQQPAQADWQDSLNNAWDTTKDLSGDTLDKTKDLYESLSGDVKLVNGNATPISTELIQSENRSHLKKIWPDVLDNLDKALKINQKIDEAPEESWFGSNKGSLTKDQFEVFDEIEALLDSPAISQNRQNIDRLRDKINDERKKIAKFKEKQVIATDAKRKKLEDKIAKAKKRINLYQNNIDYQKNNLKARLKEMGLLLDNQQIDVLLSRVDSDDIIKMSVVFDVLADVTKQLMELTKEFNEDINQARKYYGMHVVLLKVALTMQQNYINKVDQQYLPKIEAIQDETARIHQQSQALLRSEKNPSQRKVLKHNLQAQQLTQKVARLYAQQLERQKQKIEQAHKRALKDYLVAKNTFDTVKLSAELIRLMKTNQASFNALMNIQIPEIVPFKNIEMQKKFEELSLLLKRK